MVKSKMLQSYIVGKNNYGEGILKKKIVKINGGLGNQMFQYAFACALSKKFNIDITLDLSWISDTNNYKGAAVRKFELNVFEINYETATEDDLKRIVYPEKQNSKEKFLWKIFRIKKYKSPGNIFIDKNCFIYNKKMWNSSEYYYYDGYYQNEKYFKHIQKDIIKKFNSSAPLDEKNQQMLNEILQTNSVSIHIRRGDYVTLESAKNFHGNCSLDYYQKAVEYIASKVESPHFYLFSDDIDWVTKNLKIEYPFTIVDFNQDKGWLDLNLMKRCKHNIIANSTFSWWGAWLNENPHKIVISPKNWIIQKLKCDVIPREWVKL